MVFADFEPTLIYFKILILIDEVEISDLNLEKGSKIILTFSESDRDYPSFLKCLEFLHKTLKDKSKTDLT